MANYTYKFNDHGGVDYFKDGKPVTNAEYDKGKGANYVLKSADLERQARQKASGISVGQANGSSMGPGTSNIQGSSPALQGSSPKLQGSSPNLQPTANPQQYPAGGIKTITPSSSPAAPDPMVAWQQEQDRIRAQQQADAAAAAAQQAQVQQTNADYRRMVEDELARQGISGSYTPAQFNRADAEMRARQAANPYWDTQDANVIKSYDLNRQADTESNSRDLAQVGLAKQVQAFNYKKNTVDILNQMAMQGMARSGKGLRNVGLESVDNSYKQDDFGRQVKDSNQILATNLAKENANQQVALGQNLDQRNQAIAKGVDAEANQFQQQQQSALQDWVSRQQNVINSIWNKNPYSNQYNY